MYFDFRRSTTYLYRWAEGENRYISVDTSRTSGKARQQEDVWNLHRETVYILRRKYVFFNKFLWELHWETVYYYIASSRFEACKSHTDIIWFTHIFSWNFTENMSYVEFISQYHCMTGYGINAAGRFGWKVCGFGVFYARAKYRISSHVDTNHFRTVAVYLPTLPLNCDYLKRVVLGIFIARRTPTKIASRTPD